MPGSFNSIVLLQSRIPVWIQINKVGPDKEVDAGKSNGKSGDGVLGDKDCHVDLRSLNVILTHAKII